MSTASHNVDRAFGSIPARAGIGLRAQHHRELLTVRPEIGWLEAHTENYFVNGGAQLEDLLKLREHYPLSLHGVGLSLGSTDPLDREHLWRIKRLAQLSEPHFISEHLSWGSVAGIYVNDLLPLPYTEDSLRHMVRRVQQMQDYLGREILIENVSSYLRFAHSTIAEWEFVSALVAESGCGLLLDVNNVYVNSRNHGFDPVTYLKTVPRNAVREIHLAGHTVKRHDGVEILIDTHDAPVCEEVWALFSIAVERFGALPTLIEWDANIPALDVLACEARRANSYLEMRHELAA